jgi:hypothetical protein
MYRLSGAPASKPDKQHPKGQSGPLFFTSNEKATALAVAEELHKEGYQVRLIEYGGSFRAIFDSKNRSKPRKAA